MMKMTKKQLNLLLGGVCCACLCVGLGSITATAEETDTATEHTITVDLNGGFTRKGTTYSTDNITYQTTTGTFKLSHENVKVLLGNVDQITAIATDYKEKTVNGIAVDTNGYYSDSTANAIYPSALLFGLFEDSNSDGILNDNEVLYRSGDSIEINRDTTLSCYYETNRTYSTGTASTGDAYLYRAWAMDGKLTDEVTVKNTTKARSEFFDGYGLQETDFAAVGANVNVPTVDTYYTAQDLQPLYNKVTAIGQWAFSCGSGKNNISDTIKGVEIPDTVETIHANAFRWCGKLELIKGLENIKTFERYAFTNFVTDYQQVFVFGEDVSKILSEAFSNTNNVSRFIFTGYDSSLVASPLSLDLYSNAASPSSIFNPRSMQDGTFSYADPNLYIYVPYGETAKYYVMGRTSEEIANDTEVAYTVDGVSANYTVGSGTNYGVLRSNDMLMNKNGKVSNLPIREMQKVVFKLDDQILSTQFMDAGAVSVKRNNTEINVLDDVSQANAESQMVYNPSAQTLSLLSVTAPSLPEKDGYVFAGWKDQFGYVWTDTDFANGGKAGYEVATIELTASFASERTVTFVNGTQQSVVQTYEGTILTEPTVPEGKEHYTFVGWCRDETDVVTAWNFSEDTVEEDVVLYAVWVPNSYKTTLNANGGWIEVSKTVKLLNGDEYELTYQYNTEYVLPIPARDGRTFEGWFTSTEYTGDRITSISAGVSEQVPLYAKWSQPSSELPIIPVAKSYTIYYTLNGGTNHAENPETYKSGTGATLQAPLKDGYMFEGWYLAPDYSGSAVTEIEATAENDIYLYAKWSAIVSDDPETFDIVYVLNGGTNATENANTYQEGTTVSLLAPTKENAEFAGWYLTPDLTGEAVTSIDEASGTIVLYAKWKKIVTVDNGGNVGLIIGITVGAVAIVGGVGTFLFLRKKRNK